MLIIKLILLFTVILVSAYFAAIETSLMSIHLKEIKEKNKQKAKFFDYWKENPNNVIATIIIGNNFCNIGVGVFSISLAIDLSKVNSNYAILVPVLSTVILLLIGEIIPKVYARFNYEIISIAGIKYIVYLSKKLEFITDKIVDIAQIIINMFSSKHIYEKPFITSNDLKLILTQEESIEDVNKKETEILKNILSFIDCNVNQIMLPKEKIFAVDYNDGLFEILKKVILNKFSRIPVYKENINNIIGVIYRRDLIMTCREKQLFVLEDIIRPIHFIKENYSINNLLKEFKNGHYHIAMVVSDEQKVKGLVTIEDIVEQIFGKIYDEYD